MRGLTARVVKVSFPTASFLVGVLRSLVDDAIAAGATYVQFDVSGYMMLSASPLGQVVRAK